MTWDVVLDPSEVAIGRTPLNLHEGPILVDQAGIDWGEAQITVFEAQEQRYGSSITGYRIPNRQVRIPLFLGASGGSADFDTAREQLLQKVGRIQVEGGWLKRRRGGGPAMYADIASASLTLPDVWGETGKVEPNAALSLECIPDFYGDEIRLDTVLASGEMAGVLKIGGARATVDGDFPARCHVSVADQSGQDQFGLLWAFRSRRYDPAAPLILPQSSMIAAGAAGWVTDAEAIGGKRMSLSLNVNDEQVLFTFVGQHVGSYQVWARVYGQWDGSAAQFEWNIGDVSHGVITDGWVDLASGGASGITPGPTGSGYSLVNLGQIRVDPATIGDQRWAGQLRIRSKGAATFGCDRVWLQPLDEYAGHVVGGVSADPVAPADGGIQLRWDGTMRSIGSSTVFTPVTRAFGDLPRLPCSGMEGRPVEVFVKPSRGDLGFDANAGDVAPADTFAVSVSYRPCYLFHH